MIRFAESIQDMAININSFQREDDLVKEFGEYKSFKDYLVQIRSNGLSPIKVSKFVVLLFSQDSILNVKPPMILEDRQLKAAKLAGLLKKDGSVPEKVTALVFRMADRYYFSFAFEYLARDKKPEWQNIIVLEHQLSENNRLRLQPATGDDAKGAVIENLNKDKLSELNDKWRLKLAEAYADFFGDNEKMRTIHKLNRKNMAVIENFAYEQSD